MLVPQSFLLNADTRAGVLIVREGTEPSAPLQKRKRRPRGGGNVGVTTPLMGALGAPGETYAFS